MSLTFSGLLYPIPFICLFGFSLFLEPALYLSGASAYLPITCLIPKLSLHLRDEPWLPVYASPSGTNQFSQRLPTYRLSKFIIH